jgi:hypothetical protein
MTTINPNAKDKGEMSEKTFRSNMESRVLRTLAGVKFTAEDPGKAAKSEPAANNSAKPKNNSVKVKPMNNVPKGAALRV